MFNAFDGGLLSMKKFWIQRGWAREINFKISSKKVALVMHSWKDLVVGSFVL